MHAYTLSDYSMLVLIYINSLSRFNIILFREEIYFIFLNFLYGCLYITIISFSSLSFSVMYISWQIRLKTQHKMPTWLIEVSILTYNALRAAVSEKSSLSGSYSSRGVGFRECLERNIIQAFRLYRRTCPDRKNVDSLWTTRQFYGGIMAPTHPI